MRLILGNYKKCELGDTPEYEKNLNLNLVYSMDALKLVQGLFIPKLVFMPVFHLESTVTLNTVRTLFKDLIRCGLCCDIKHSKVCY